MRGDGVRELGLELPPGPMPGWRAGRPLKRWRYVGVYTSELMLCVGDARIGPLPQRWWAVAFPDGRLRERTTIGRGGVRIDGSQVRVDARGVRIDGSQVRVDARGVRIDGSQVRVDARGVRIELELQEGPGVETASPIGERDAYIWTSKQAGVPVRGTVAVDGVELSLDGEDAFIDDSAGYHARHTAWKWSAGLGRTADGRRVGWNLVTGIHDAAGASERSLWIDGEPREIGPVTFSDDLSGVAFGDGCALGFSEWSAREANTNALLVRSRYRQPFGTFTGSLPGGLQLAEGFGVMEDHDVWW